MTPGIGPGSAELSMFEGADLRELRAVRRLRRCRSCASASEQAVLPSAALGLIEKPGGRVTVVALISDGEGIVGLCGCGNVRSTSSPEARVGLGGRRLRGEARVEAELVAAGGCGQGVFGVVDAAVVGDDVQLSGERNRRRSVGFWRNGVSGLFEATGKGLRCSRFYDRCSDRSC